MSRHLGKYLAHLMEKRGVNAPWVSERSGVCRVGVNQLKTKQYWSLQSVDRIAPAFKMTTSKFIAEAEKYGNVQQSSD